MHTSSIPVDSTPRTHTLTYDFESKEVQWFISGIRQVTVTSVPMNDPIYAVTILGDSTNTSRARGWGVSRYTLWRVPLQNSSLVGSIVNGEVYAGSMLFDMDFTCSNIYAAQNKINTLTRAVIGPNVTYSRP